MRLLLALFLVVSPIWPLGKNPLPGDPFLIINKQKNELAFIQGGTIKKTYKVATGKTNDLTPEGLFTITVKAKNPYYRKKDIPGGDPRNPLGTRWIGFDAKNTDGRIYGVHGTNQPGSIGKYISNGCLRLLNSNVEELYDVIPIGTKILVVKSNQSFVELGKEYGAIK
ncbi:lipoprotein-anchoring transpeptidase ErfK/SrfK [Bacillus pakistanensis]|uniref:Lipoprotein-anchoring transpeptidase ErfK/SrfK n=1 Tax=Rossellomorea pakistanensis TaxID=992288 RepID=A0ABS2N9P9_9BACI|nr:L,D-transpeptidase [Bacillus pakistanensis]MBM7584544.1 lipoprotein-anchoring transpeptidase ErfK/SrfK [Bacillus pakistanensis]